MSEYITQEDADRIVADGGTDFRQAISKPEWLDDGLKHGERVFRLAQQGKIPESIKGWMVVNACMRVLRSVYGDDLTTAIQIRERVMQRELRATEAETERR